MTQAQRAVPAHTADPEWARTRVLDGHGVSRVLTRLAHEIVEGHPGDMDRVVLAGVREGGVGWLAISAPTSGRSPLPK